MTWGIVAGFAAWLLKRGYAIGTVNARMSVVKIYARLAMQTGAIAAGEWNAIHPSARTAMPRGATSMQPGLRRGSATRRPRPSVSPIAGRL
jgi:hypothetical protein